MKLGCHAVLFTDQIVKDTDALLAKLSTTGAAGVEIGARFFGVERSDYLREMLDKNKLELSGLHASQMLTDFIDNPEKCLDELSKAAQFLQVMPNKNIIMTGMIPEMAMPEPKPADKRLADADCLKDIALSMNAIAIKLKQAYGVQLHYHNHNWEFKNGGLIFFAIADHAPAVKFALDTGWAAVSGYHPIQLIQQYPGRFQYVHLRDYNQAAIANDTTFAEYQNGFVEIGQGDMNYSQLLPVLLAEMSADGWAIIEYEKGEVDPLRYTKAINHLQSILTAMKALN